MPNTARQSDLGLPLNIQYHWYASAEPDVLKMVTDAIEEFGAHHMGVPDTILLSGLLRIGLPSALWHTFYYGAIPIKIVSPFDAPEHLKNITVQADTVICFRHNIEADLAADYTTAVMNAVDGISEGEQHEPTRPEIIVTPDAVTA